MRENEDVACRAHRRKFPHLRETATADDVGNGAVRELFVKDRSEVSARDKTLADADRYGDLVIDEG